MDKLAAMRAFVEIADQGSLTAAARVLDKSQPTMVRTLANLEETLGVRLLRRTTRRLSLTADGRGYLDRCRRILADIDEAERALGSGHAEPRGELRVSAPVTFGQWHVAPVIARFLERYPEVNVELLLLDRVVHLLEEGFDLAVRIGVLADSSMIAVPVGRMRRVVAASPGYLQRVGIPERPESLAECDCVLFRGLTTVRTWRFSAKGREVAVPVKGRLVTNQALAAVESCVAGLGFGMFLAYQVEPWVRIGHLQLVLEAFESPAVPVSLVYSDARLMSSRLRACIDFLKDSLPNSFG